VSFFQLSLIAAVALLGPLLALPQKWHLPVVLGQLLAGAAVGRTGLGLVDFSDSTFTFMADVGFALIMFVAGTHVPVRDAAIRSALGGGVLRAGMAAVLAAAVGSFIAFAFGTGHAPLYIVLLASSSAALVLPIVDSLRLTGPKVLTMTAQVAVADIAAIVALPLAVDPSNAPKAAVGAAVVAASAAVLFVVLRWLERTGTRGRVHAVSESRKFALELRIQLALLFALSGLAVAGNVSIMLAGFSFGLVVAAVGEPRRLAHQLFAVSDGFLGPVFFVWLGASLDLRTLAGSPKMILLGISLGLGTLLVHGSLRLLGQPLPLAVLAASQMGVPVAAATLGSQLHLSEPGEAAAIILGALISIGASTIAGSRAARTFTQPAPAPAGKPPEGGPTAAA
jgi:Kef-type K+ transport system membrane component KefB